MVIKHKKKDINNKLCYGKKKLVKMMCFNPSSMKSSAHFLFTTGNESSRCSVLIG